MPSIRGGTERRRSTTSPSPGSNQFHGNLYELWNGSRFNAADYFTNATPGNHKPRSTVNHFGGSLGGPIVRDKLFFFFDSEWVRIALPIVTATTVPTPAFQNYVLQQLPLGGTDSVTGSVYPAGAAIGAVLSEDVFALRKHERNAARRARLSVRCGRQRGSRQSPTMETAAPIARAFRIRATITSRSRRCASTTTSTRKTPPGSAFRPTPDCRPPTPIPINPLFNALSPQPLYSFAAGYTHVFSQNLVNYFNPAFSWYGSLFGPSDFQKTLAAFPIVLQGSGANAPFTTLGGLDNTWVQGRRASRFFINDNLAWSHGAHELRFGTNTRIFRLNDYDFGEGIGPDRDLHDPAAIHLRRRVHGDKNFPHVGKRTFQLPESRSLCAGHLESDQEADVDFRHSRHVQFQSAESARRRSRACAALSIPSRTM